jgi:hypothetical protein
VSYRRVFDTEEAVIFSKGQKGKGAKMGNEYFRKLLESEATKGADKDGRPYTTYHLGDAYYTGDIRRLVGVVRWKSSDMEAAPVNIFACKERPGMEALTQFLAPEFAV